MAEASWSVHGIKCLGVSVLNDDLLRLLELHVRVVIVVEFLRLKSAEAGILVEAIAWGMKAGVTIVWALVV